LEHSAHELARIDLVVDDEDARTVELRHRRRALRGVFEVRVASMGMRDAIGLDDRKRQAHDERRPMAFAGAFRTDRPAVQLDELLRDREPESEAAVRASRRAVALREAAENVRQEVGRYADAGVADRDLDVR